MAGRPNERSGCISAALVGRNSVASCAGFVSAWRNTLRYCALHVRSGSIHRMKPPAFEYRVAGSVEAALATLSEAGGEAKILAGGQSLVPMLNFRLLRPAILVDINRIPGFGYIEEDTDAIRL